jgi:hypothetical protein
MSYFSGSLLNPKVPNGKDNRNKTPFDQYFPDINRPSSPGVQMSAPRNEAFQLPPILNPSASYRAFAQPKPNRPFLGFLKDARNFTKGRSTGYIPDERKLGVDYEPSPVRLPVRTPDPQPRFGVPYIGDTPLFKFLNPPNRNPSRDFKFNPFRRNPSSRLPLYPQITNRRSINPILANPIPPMFMRR